MSEFFDLLEDVLRTGRTPTSHTRVSGEDAARHPLTERIREQAALDREERDRQSAIIRECFSTPAGRACLKLLIAKTVARPLTDAELNPASIEAFALLKARRDGAAQLIHMIHAALADEPMQEGV